MFIVCDPDGRWRSALRGRLPDGAVTELDDLPSLRAAIDDLRAPTTLLLGPSLPTDRALDLAGQVERRELPAGVILFQHELDPGVLRDALRGGVVDVLLEGASDAELHDAVARADHEARQHLPVGHDGDGQVGSQVTTVFSTKGGCGKSLIASNLAILLAQQDEGDVVLVDLDLQSGDLAIMLQVMPALSLYDASLNIDRLDVDALAGYLTRHSSGIQLLAAPLEPSLAENVTAAAVTTIINLLRVNFAHVVIDGPAFFTDQILAAIDLSDSIVLVASLDVPSVKNLRLALNTLHQLGHSRESILTVLNRADSNVGLRASEVEKSLGTSIDVQLPSSRDVPLSINQGAPLAADRRRSDVVQAIAQLLPSLTITSPETSASRGRIFSRRRV